MLEAIKLFLSQSISDTIYLGRLPAEPDTALALFQTPGLPPDPKFDYDSVGLQVRCRATTLPVARALINTAYSKLQGLHGVTISGIYFVDVKASQAPYQLGFDAQDRTEYIVNFLLEVYSNTEHRI